MQNIWIKWIEWKKRENNKENSKEIRYHGISANNDIKHIIVKLRLNRGTKMSECDWSYSEEELETAINDGKSEIKDDIRNQINAYCKKYNTNTICISDIMKIIEKPLASLDEIITKS